MLFASSTTNDDGMDDINSLSGCPRKDKVTPESKYRAPRSQMDSWPTSCYFGFVTRHVNCELMTQT